jgi:CRISPR-associated protein Cmr3
MSAAAPDRIGLRLEPLDVLFFRDGRPFDEGSQAVSGLPAPQTLAGALRTWLLREAGCDFERLGAAMRVGKGFASAAAEAGCGWVGQIAFRGPWLALYGKPLVPMPASLWAVETGDGGGKEFVRLDPLESATLPGWAPPEPGMLPLWQRDRRPARRAAGWLTPAGLTKFLAGEVPEPKEILKEDKLFGTDRRTGIAIDTGKRTAAEGLIYGAGMLALGRGVSFYAEVAGPEEALKRVPAVPEPIRFGGEGRRVAVRRLDRPFDWPRATGDGRPLLLLTTPGLFGPPRWRPEWLKARAAAVPGHLAVSGWDLAAGGPKPARFAAQAGSVYFLENGLEPPRGSLCDGEDAAQGWGAFVEGRWNRV